MEYKSRSINLSYDNAFAKARKCKILSEDIGTYIEWINKINGNLSGYTEPSIPIAQEALSEIKAKLEEIAGYLESLSITTNRNTTIIKETQNDVTKKSQNIEN